MIAKGNHSCKKIKKTFTNSAAESARLCAYMTKRRQDPLVLLDFGKILGYRATETGYGPKGITTVLSGTVVIFFYAHITEGKGSYVFDDRQLRFVCV